MPIAVEAGFAKAPHALRELLAASARFQTLVGAANATEAKDHIYIGEARDKVDRDSTGDLTDPRPRAIIEYAAESHHNSSTASFLVQGTLALTLELELPSDADFTVLGGTLGVPTDEHTWVMNQVGKILSEMKTAIPTNGALYLQATHIDQEYPPTRIARQSSITRKSDGTATATRIPYFYATVHLFRYFSI